MESLAMAVLDWQPLGSGAGGWWTWHAAKALIAAGGLVAVSCATETLYYRGLVALEKAGVIERLAPQIKTTVVSYTHQTAITFLLSSWAVLLVALHPAVAGHLLSTAHPRWNLVEIVATCWVGVALHDAWFFLIHTILHHFKVLYRTIHITHHKLGGDLTVFGTADMDPFEAITMVFAFYAAALLYYAYGPAGSWNPVAYAALLALECNMNMMGHCGYRQPMWLKILQSGGVCLTPGAAHAKTHYIHHLDPRRNRALYFTWWDRVAGTFQDKHPAIKEFNPQEQHEYETRAFRMLWSQCQRWTGEWNSWVRAMVKQC